MPTTPGPLTDALAAVWEAVRTHHPDAPRARIGVADTPIVLAHGQERWTMDDEGMYLLLVPAEILRRGPESTVTCILHEAAHLLNLVRGVNDTSSGGGYHTKKYLDAAKEVGLTWPDGAPRHATAGYAAAELPSTTLDRYVNHLKPLAAAIEQTLPYLAAPEPTRSSRHNRLIMECSCKPQPRKIQVSRTVAGLGPIMCGVCNKPFT
ncbi:hypothetical protein [Streptomyces asiaticus]|uniref:hypothetical protein n=1 Tax=Streptomyces asiaticus TaxID=114695 RepID=UPI001BAB45E7|nr:hypothetical protein [Streptomyces asiaticus]